MAATSLRPDDVSDFADRLLRDLPRLRGLLAGAVATAGRAAEGSSPAAAAALRTSGDDLRHAVGGLDTSLNRLGAALRLAAADLAEQDAEMWGRRP